MTTFYLVLHLLALEPAVLHCAPLATGKAYRYCPDWSRMVDELRQHPI